MKFKKNNSKLSFKTKVIFALSPIITLPILISCGVNQPEQGKGLNIESPKSPDNSHSDSKSSSIDISSLKQEIQDVSSLDKVSKSLFDKLDSLSLDADTKARRKKQLQRTIDLIKKQIETEGIESEQTKMVINSLDEIFKPQEKENQPLDFTPEPSVSDERVKKFEQELADAKPKGQTVPEFKDGVRIVGDQYQYDFPKKELNYVLTYFKIGGSQSATYAWKPSKVFGPWDGTNAPQYSSELEELARKVDQPLPQNAYYRTFVTPDPNNRDLIHIPITKRSFPIPPISFYTSGPQKGQINKDESGPLHFGLPRDIVNDDYRELIDNAVSVSIGDGVIGTKEVVGPDGQKHFEEDYREPGQERGNTEAKRGTMNIIDYKIPENSSSYPLTWYFITNTHVLAQLRLKNDQGDGVYGRDTSNYNTHNVGYNTKDINISKLIKEKVQLDKVIPLVGQDNWNDYYKQIKIDPKNVKLVMIGSKIMNQNLGDLTHQDFWKGVNFLMDVGIIEITFENEQQAKDVTLDWYNKHKDTNKDGKYVLTSDVNLLDKEQYSKLPKNPFYAFGFPTSAFEKMIPQIDHKIPQNNGRSFDKPAIENLLDGSISPLINKPSKLFPIARPSQKYLEKLKPLKEGGGDLNWSRSFRSFMSTPGLMDIFIAAPYLDGGGQILEKYDETTHKFNKDDLYVFSGLGTTLDNMSGHGGMSGSAVYLKDNHNNKKMYGLVYMSGPNASVAGVLNLRSYGKNYEGYYGKYNLPQYDLIYGGGKDQRKSYFDAMQHMYTNKNNNVKTFLFPKGFDNSHRIHVFQNSKNLSN